MPITSKDNLQVKEARMLKNAKNRKEHGLFLAEGPHLVGELFRANLRLERIFVDYEAQSREIHGLIQQAHSLQVPVVEVTSQVFRTLCETEQPQGILAVVRVKTEMDLPKQTLQEKTMVLIADRIQDPGNLGTLLRTAWGFGVDLCIVTPGTVDPYNAKVLRASMGGVFHLPIVQAEPSRVLSWAKEENIQLFAGDPLGANDLHRVCFPMRAGIIVGNEGAGLSQLWEESPHLQKLFIPMPGYAESLNVTIAASIMLYEASGQIKC